MTAPGSPVGSPIASPVVSATGLRRTFGAQRAVDGVDLALGAGECLALFGPNGAGKTTLLRLLAGLARPTAGEARIGAIALPEATARARVGLISHKTMLYDALTARENVRFAADLHGLAEPARATAEVLEALAVTARADVPVRALSRGMRQRVAVARAVVHAPEVILCDEPYTGLDEVGAAALTALLRARQAAGAALVLVTHHLQEGLALATQVAPRRLTPPGLLATALRIARKDLAIEFRTRSAFLSALVLSLLAIVIFYFAWDPTAVAPAVLAPGVLWVTFTFSGLLGLHRSFGVESADGAMDALLVAPVPREAIFLGKALANLAFVLGVQAVSLPALALFYNLPVGSAAAPLAAVLVLAAIGLVAIGTLFAGVAANSRLAELLLPVLALPFFVPVVMPAAQATARLLAGRPLAETLDWLRILIAFDLVFCWACMVVFPHTLDD